MFLVCFFAVLCNVASAQQDEPAASPSKPDAADEGANLVVARVSGEPITEKQILSAVALIAKQKTLPPDRLKDRNSLLFKDALDSLVMVAILRGEVRHQNIKVDATRVDQQVQQISKQFPSQAEFQKAMAGQGITETELRNSIEDRMSLQQLMDQTTKDVPGATDEEVTKFYNENPNRFMTPEQVRAAHILLTVDAKSTPEQKADIKKKLEGIRAEIESNAITFTEAAAKYSQDPSNAQKGGDLGLFPRGRMVKPFEEVAFGTKPGTISPVIETQFGYHILQVHELKPAGKRSLEEVKPSIRQYLDQQTRQKAFQKYTEELKAKTTIETYMTAEEFAKRHP
jgi:peptidyl-prolyl cis-trans isomerase C